MLKNLSKIKSFKTGSFKKYGSFKVYNNTNWKISSLCSSLINKRICMKEYSNAQPNAIEETRSEDRGLNEQQELVEAFGWDDSVNLFMELKILGDKLGYHWQVENKYLDQVEMKDWTQVDPVYIPIKSWTYNFRYLIINFSKKKIYIAEEPLGLEGESLREMLRVFCKEPLVNGEIFYLSKLLEQHSKMSTEESDKNMQNMFEHISNAYREKQSEELNTSEGNAKSEIGNNSLEDLNFCLKTDFHTVFPRHLFSMGVEKEKDEIESNIHPLSEAYSNHFLTKSRADQMREEQWYTHLTKKQPNLSIRERYDRLAYTFQESSEWYSLLKDFNLDVSKFPFYSRVKHDLEGHADFSENFLGGLDSSSLQNEDNFVPSGSLSSSQNLFDPKDALIDKSYEQGSRILQSISAEGGFFFFFFSFLFINFFFFTQFFT